MRSSKKKKKKKETDTKAAANPRKRRRVIRRRVSSHRSSDGSLDRVDLSRPHGQSIDDPAHQGSLFSFFFFLLLYKTRI